MKKNYIFVSGWNICIERSGKTYLHIFTQEKNRKIIKTDFMKKKKNFPWHQISPCTKLTRNLWNTLPRILMRGTIVQEFYILPIFHLYAKGIESQTWKNHIKIHHSQTFLEKRSHRKTVGDWEMSLTKELKNGKAFKNGTVKCIINLMLLQWVCEWGSIHVSF